MFYPVTWSREIALKIPQKGKMRINRKVLQLLQILSRLSLEKDPCWRIIVRVFAVMRSSLRSDSQNVSFILKPLFFTVISSNFRRGFPVNFRWNFAVIFRWYFSSNFLTRFLSDFPMKFPSGFLMRFSSNFPMKFASDFSIMMNHILPTFFTGAHAPVRCRFVWGLRFSFHARTQDWTDAPNER